ncbi:hypothetical protein N9490_03025 [Planktomarina temperata]|nr:hypothetical protein [Planktomarina temperata]
MYLYRQLKIATFCVAILLLFVLSGQARANQYVTFDKVSVNEFGKFDPNWMTIVLSMSGLVFSQYPDEKLDISIRIDGSHKRGKFHALGLYENTFENAIPRKLSYEYDSDDFQNGRFYINESSLNNGSFGNLLEYLPNKDKLKLQAVCLFLVNNATVLPDVLVTEASSDKSEEFWSRKGHSRSIFKLANNCLYGTGFPDFRLIKASSLMSPQATCNMTPPQTKLAQKKLRVLGLYRSKVDGIRGAITIEAIKKVEKTFMYYSDGISGCLSIEELARLTALANYKLKNENFELSEVSSEEKKIEPSTLSDEVTATTAVDNPSEHVSNLKVKIANIEQDLSVLKDANHLLENKNNAMESQLSTALENLETYQLDLRNLEGILIRKDEENDNLVLRVSNEQVQNEKLRDALSQQQTDLENIIQEYEIRIADLEAEVLSLTAEVDERSTAPLTQRTRFELSKDWQVYKEWISPSQMRFCGILHDYEIAKREAALSGNQLLQNMAIKDRDKDIEALLSDSRNGQDGFRNWVSVVESVFAMNAFNPTSEEIELAAGVILKTPCNITLGTGRILDESGQSTSKFKYLAFDGDLIFSQLASVRRGDPVLFDGSFEKSASGGSEMIITNELGVSEKIDEYTKPADAPDMFVNIYYLVKL